MVPTECRFHAAYHAPQSRVIAFLQQLHELVEDVWVGLDFALNCRQQGAVLLQLR